MAAADSLVDLNDGSPETRSRDDDVDSLPSLSVSDDDLCSEADSDAQAEWDRSMEQLQLLLTMILVPWAGKLLGRKFAYWGWGRYMDWVYSVDVPVASKAKTRARSML